MKKQYVSLIFILVILITVSLSWAAGEKEIKDVEIPILLYHDFYEEEPSKEQYGIASTPQKFEKDILYLINKGYTFISINDIIDYKNGLKTLPSKSVSLTFDDGHMSNYTLIYPILKKYNIPAIIFVAGNLIGTDNYFDWDAAKEMQDSKLVTIASHGYRHTDMRKVEIEELKEKNSNFLKVLEEKLGKQKYIIFAYPHGYYNEETNAALKEVGVEVFMTTHLGANTKKELSLGLLNRNLVYYNYIGFDFDDIKEIEENKDNQITGVETPKSGFNDVSNSHWAKEVVKFVKDNNIMDGTKDDNFSPDEFVRFSLLSDVVSKMCDSKLKFGVTTKWKVEPGQEGYKATKKNVIEVLVKVMKLDDRNITVSKENKAKASKITSDAELQKKVGYMLQLGIMQGDGSSFGLDGRITRAQLAQVVYNLYKATSSLPQVIDKTLSIGTLTSGNDFIINMDNKYIKQEEVEQIIIMDGEESLVWRDKTTEKEIQEGKESSYKEIKTSGGAKVQVVDGRVAIIIPIGSQESKILGSKVNELNITIKTTATVFTGTAKDIQKIEQVEMKCNRCQSETYWEQTGTMHVLVCKADKTHVILIEGHSIEEGECMVCKYKETEVYESSFVDLQKDHWAYKNIAYMEKLDIAKGGRNSNNEKVILSEEIIKAEEFIALMARVVGYSGLDEIKDEAVYNPFGKEGIIPYWSRGEWKYLNNYLEKELGRNAKKEIQILLSNNARSGSDAEIVENYRKPITRERAAYLLGALMSDQVINKTIGKGLADDFADWGEISNGDYRNRLEMLSAYDVLRGVPNYTDGRVYLQPKGQLTRAQAIALIDRYNSIRNLTFGY